MALEAWLRLLQAVGPGPCTWSGSLAAPPAVERLVDAGSGRLAEIGLRRAAIERLKSPDGAQIECWARWLDQPGHALVPIDSGAYPAELAELPDAPLALWLRGPRPELLDGPKLAIVGSRHPTRGGVELARRFAEGLSAAGITIVSGLAVGIDAAGHAGALPRPGRTIAVLGNGIDSVYPRANAALAREIAAGGGLIVSEYPPGTGVRRHHFPERNRIIAGLCLGTLVVEATRRSGSLITARLAADYARDVFAIPGSIHDPLARGCHRLLRNGAILVEDIDDVLEEIAPQLGPACRPAEPRRRPDRDGLTDDPSYAGLLDVLDFAPTSVAELIERSGLTAAELSSMLLQLELSGAVEALPGAQYCRSARRLTKGH
jgi:DNA processing protein